MRQGLAKAGPLLCLQNLGVYYTLPAESRTLRIQDVSQATFSSFREVERPQLCTVKKTQSSRRFGEAARPQFAAVAALAAEPRVPQVDRDYWGYQSYEESPPDGDAGVTEMAPAPGERRVPHVALPNNDGDAIQTICRIVGFPDRKDPE